MMLNSAYIGLISIQDLNISLRRVNGDRIW
jgi:hypothetical protein